MEVRYLLLLNNIEKKKCLEGLGRLLRPSTPGNGVSMELSSEMENQLLHVFTYPHKF